MKVIAATLALIATLMLAGCSNSGSSAGTGGGAGSSVAPISSAAAPAFREERDAFPGVSFLLSSASPE